MIYRLFVTRSACRALTAFILFMFFSQSGKDMEHRAVGDLSLNKSLSSTSVSKLLTVSYVVWKSIMHPAKTKPKKPHQTLQNNVHFIIWCATCAQAPICLFLQFTSEEYTAHFDNNDLASSTCTLLYNRHSFLATKPPPPQFTKLSA